ncbi:MAG: trimeric intracellular cation channel family protein [Ilumatobacter sp.]|nr:trimeric intracellular cation channel family protein [Ilumatobacter sp.]
MTDALDLLGIFVFAVSGCVVAVRRGFDIVGLVALGTVTGLAGGITRDLLIGEIPPVALREWEWLIVPVVAAVVVALMPRLVERLHHPVLVFDAAGLGLFAAVGASRAVDAPVSVPAAVLVGAISAIGGGLLRDVLAGEVPQIFSADSRLYAIPATIGASIVVLGDEAGLAVTPVEVVAVIVTFVLRMGALRFGWHAPIPRRTVEADHLRSDP